jgi:hypothetical protein
VAVEGAVELVLALLEARADGRGAAWAHDLAVLVDAIALDGDAVLKTGRGGFFMTSVTLPCLAASSWVVGSSSGRPRKRPSASASSMPR